MRLYMKHLMAMTNGEYLTTSCIVLLHARPLALTSFHVTANDPTTAISPKVELILQHLPPLGKQKRASALAHLSGSRRKYEHPWERWKA